MKNFGHFLRIVLVDQRYDEYLTEAFDLRVFPSVYVIDDAPNGIDNGTVYQWDSYEWLNNDTFADWLLNETYKNSSIQFRTPRLMFDDELRIQYIKKWFRTNFGSRFCRATRKVPGLTKAMFMFCDHDQTDLLGKKEDRFNMVVIPLIFLLFVIPWGWWLLKNCCSCIMWCCTWEVYVDETEENEKKDN